MYCNYVCRCGFSTQKYYLIIADEVSFAVLTLECGNAQNRRLGACQSRSLSVGWTPIGIYHTCWLKIETIHTPIISPSLPFTSPPSHYLAFLNTSLFLCLLLTPPPPPHSYIATLSAVQSTHFAYMLTGTYVRHARQTSIVFLIFFLYIFLNMSSAVGMFLFPWLP